MLVVAVDDVSRRRDAIAAALDAGFDAVQLRDRAARGRPMLAAPHAPRPLTTVAGARLIVNDRADIAIAADADGVHLPAASFTIAAARALVGEWMLIGRSTHAPAEVRAAEADGAD